jgi:2-phosphosulfolactate phosphatase
MRLRVDLTPRSNYQDVVIVIDVLRSCTVAPILFRNGLVDLYLCPSVRASREAAAARDLLLLGERRGLPPEGFNYGNSPAELQSVPLHGRSAVMVSENAPKTVPHASLAKHVLLGALYNADAVVAHAHAVATEEIALVCSGFGGSEDLDDAFTAGYLAARLKQTNPDLKLDGAALMTISLLKAFPNALDALWQSRTGHYLRSINLPEDIAVGAFISQADVVPKLREVEAFGTSKLYRFSPAER